ncbi:MAG: carboxypeptidase regulatory-like domain-containing protein [Patescibacteria group bacterium]|nr:carboxypeptidase regulatory-like domain-containing protein [Patescibacteria group bacterium]
MFQNLNSKFQDKNGFTLIEGVVSIALFSIIFLALFALFGTVLSTIRNNKARIIANSIALEQLEIIRGMEFDSIKTIEGWTPPGPLASEKTINKAGFNFAIQTDIAFIDDAYDGIKPVDSFYNDYKKARIRVSWLNPFTKSQETVAMSTTVVPPGMEGLSEDRGGLMITVFDAVGKVIFGANVHIESVSQGYTADATTDLNGNLWVPNLEPSDDYHIVVTMAGYSTDQTYSIDNNPASPDYNPNPTKPDAVVIANSITAIGFSIDILGYLNIQTVNYDNPQNWQINSDLGADSQTEVAVDIDSGDNLFVVWLDDRDGPERFYAQKYKYNPVTVLYEKQWASDIRITVANNKRNPRIAVLGTTNFYILGADDRNGNKDIFLEKYNSADGSEVWNGVKVNIDASSADQINADLTVDSFGNIYVVWMDDRNANWDIYAQKYDPAGNNLWAVDLKINSDVGIKEQMNSKVVVDNNDNFYVVWEDEINGDKDIFLSKFDANGNTLFAGKKINTDSSGLDQYEPAIVFDGNDYLYISWSDKRNCQPDIYAQKYDKLGSVATDGNWAVGDVKINDDILPDAWRTKSSVAYFDNDAIYFSWEDNRNGDDDIYSTKFNSDGNKLWGYDLIMNSSAGSIQGAPDIVTDSMGYGITVWEDSRGGDYDIYAARYKDLGFFTRTNVPIIITGTKQKGTYPNSSPPPDDLPIYKYEETFTSDVTGNISVGDGVAEIEWDAYNFSAGGAYTIISTDQSEPLSITPGGTENIIINVEP